MPILPYLTVLHQTAPSKEVNYLNTLPDLILWYTCSILPNWYYFNLETNHFGNIVYFGFLLNTFSIRHNQ